MFRVSVDAIAGSESGSSSPDEYLMDESSGVSVATGITVLDVAKPDLTPTLAVKLLLRVVVPIGFSQLCNQ